MAKPEAATENTRADGVNTVFTIGHSTRSLEEVVQMLNENGVTRLVDVRSLPGSRKFPQWNQESLKEELPEGVNYTWLPKLGGRRYTPTSVPSPNTGWRVKAFRDYADYMATDQFEEGLAELESLARGEKVAIMCSEAVPWRCHRRLITDALLQGGVQVKDIMGEGKVREASMTPFAHVGDGVITYPATSS